MNPTHPNDPKGEAGAKKTPLHLLPPYALAQTSLAHAEGAKKYGLFNWRTSKVCATTYIGAILRHLTAWQDGEDIDADSGLSHIAKIGACCNILLDAEHCGTLVDDRSKVPSKALQNFIDEESRRFFRECRDVNVLLGEKESPIKKTQIGGPNSGFEQHGVPAEPASGWGKVMAEIEAQLPLPEGLPQLPPVPEGFSRWEYRGMGWKADFATFSWLLPGETKWVPPIKGRARGYTANHYIEAVK